MGESSESYARPLSVKMQTVSAQFLSVLRSNSRDLVGVVEYYHYNAVPGPSGFDPAQSDFITGFAEVGGLTFRTRTYQRRVKNFGDVHRTITSKTNSASVSLSNLERDIAALHFGIGFEGLICVVRLLSRSLLPSAALADSMVLSVGRCEKPDSFDRGSEAVSIAAKQIVGSTELVMPRRKFTPDDEDGRHPSDVLFEGFRFSVQYGTVSYSVRERRGGLLGLLGFKKNVTRTLQYSSHSDLDSEKAVPEVFGRAQMAANHLAYEDRGTFILMTSAFCEGIIQGFQNSRSVTPGFTLTAFDPRLGFLGNQNGQVPNPVANFPGRGYYSRLAYAYMMAAGTTAQQDDPAPEVVAIVLGRLMTLPNESGVFNLLDRWTDSPVAQARHILTSDDFLKLGANFVDDSINFESYRYCNEILLDTSQSDSVYLPQSQAASAGTDYLLYLPTGTITPEYLKIANGGSFTDEEEAAPYVKEPEYKFYENNNVPIEPDPPGGGGGGGGALLLPPFVLRRRYTSNVSVTEQQKIVDFLHTVLFPAARLYLVSTAQGKIGIRVAKPVDNTTLRSNSAPGAGALAVFDVEPWKSNLGGKLLVGAYLTSSEIRSVVAANYTTDSNGISISATGLSLSGPTFSGATNSTSTAHATMTVPSGAGEKTLSIDGFSISYTPTAGDTEITIAGFFAYAVSAHPVLQKYIKATWAGTAQVTFSSKLGTLSLDAGLSNAHSAGIASPTTAPTVSAAAGGSLGAGNWKVSYSYQTTNGETLPSPQTTVAVSSGQKLIVSGAALPPGATAINWYVSIGGGSNARLRRVLQNGGAGFEITAAPSRNNKLEPNYNGTGEDLMRVAFAFADRQSAQSQLSRSNMLAGSFKFQIGKKQDSVNRIDLKFRDATQDFKLTELRVKDSEHIARVKKVLPKEVNGAAIDNFHQAKRIANGALAEAREGDFYTGHSSDGEALLLEEGDVVCLSDASGGFVNLPVRIEEVTVKIGGGHPEIHFASKKYQHSFYDDDVAEKVLPLPTNLRYPRAGSKGTVTALTENTTIKADDAARIYSNADATDEITVTLAEPTNGDYFEFIVAENQTVNLESSVPIRIDTLVTTPENDGSRVHSKVVGSTIRLKAGDENEWTAVGLTGDWNLI